MAYDEELAERIRELTVAQPGLSEMRAFGGLAFLVDGKMAVSASGQGGLMVRVDPEAADELLQEPMVEPFEMRGRPMRGWVRVASKAVEDDRDLCRWVERGLAYARTLPAKE